MAEESGQIQRVLTVLAANGDIIAEAMSGPVYAGGKKDKAIDALVAIHALAPYEEGIYQLNPRLRDFISDHLASYNPNQSLNRLSEATSQARAQWRSLRTFKREGALADMDRLQWALDATLTSLNYEMDRNLTLLNSLLSTDFGNVDSLKGKIEQNEFYNTEVNYCLDEIRHMNSVMDDISGEALAEGIPSVRSLVNVRILARLPNWTSRLNDVQRRISARLFLQKRLDRQQHNLGKVTLWLARNRLSEGFDIAPGTPIPLALIQPGKHKLQWSLDPRNQQLDMQDRLAGAVARLPPRPSPTETGPKNAPTALLYTEQQEVPAHRHPADELIDTLLDHLNAQAEHGNHAAISLMRWKRESAMDEAIDDETWVIYACSQLASMSCIIDYHYTEREQDIFNDLFIDADVSPPEWASA